MAYKLFLDDIRDPRTTTAYSGFDEDFFKDVLIARSYDEAVKLIYRHGIPYVLMLDYNLGEYKYSGLEVLQYFIDQVKIDPSLLPQDFKYFIHTDSPVCGKLMERTMREFLEKIGR